MKYFQTKFEPCFKYDTYTHNKYDKQANEEEGDVMIN